MEPIVVKEKNPAIKPLFFHDFLIHIAGMKSIARAANLVTPRKDGFLMVFVLCLIGMWDVWTAT